MLGVQGRRPVHCLYALVVCLYIPLFVYLARRGGTSYCCTVWLFVDGANWEPCWWWRGLYAVLKKTIARRGFVCLHCLLTWTEVHNYYYYYRSRTYILALVSTVWTCYTLYHHLDFPCCLTCEARSEGHVWTYFLWKIACDTGAILDWPRGRMPFTMSNTRRDITMCRKFGSKHHVRSDSCLTALSVCCSVLDVRLQRGNRDFLAPIWGDSVRETHG